MIFEGVIKMIGNKESVGQNAMPKLSFVVEEITDKDYKGSLCIDLIKDKTDLINEFSVGDQVRVNLNSRCNEYNGRWFNSITAWKIEPLSGGSSSQSSSKSKKEDDDLPF